MTGKPLFDKILFAASALTALASAGLVYYSHNMIEKPKVNADQSFSDMANNQVQKLEVMKVNVDEIIVNLYSRKTRLKFLKVKMDLELYEESHSNQVKSYIPLLNDIVIDIAGNMKAEDLNSITGKILFESRIKKRLSNRIGASLVKKIYFSKFIIQ